METLFTEIVKSSPILGLMLVFWYYQRKDYSSFVNTVQSENSVREQKYQETISKNQDIIIELTQKFNVVEDVKKDVEEIKETLKSN